MKYNRSFKTIRCKNFKKKFTCCSKNCKFAHDIIFYNRLPGVFFKLKHKFIKGYGVLDGHVVVEFE